jgi:uncharacterized membrane protein
MTQQHPADPGRPYHPAPYGQPYPVAPEHPQGTTVLVLGIVGLVFGLVAPVAWYLGSKAMREIRSSGQVYSNTTSINIGRLLGMIVTIVLLVGMVIVAAGAIIFAVAAAGQS